MMVNKAIIFDSGTLISLAMNGLLPELKKLKFTVSWKERLREKEYSVDFFTYLAPKE